MAEVYHENAPRWLSLNLTDDKSTLVQVVAWHLQGTTITWANVDPDSSHHMASLRHKELSDKTYQGPDSIKTMI